MCSLAQGAASMGTGRGEGDLVCPVSGFCEKEIYKMLIIEIKST
jgi:hypothetical protein